MVEKVTLEYVRYRRVVEREQVLCAHIRSQQGEFLLADIERVCPGVGREGIRKLLVDLSLKNEVEVGFMETH